MGDNNEATIATMQSDVGYLKADVHEIKADIKEQGKVLDELARNWQEFGGLAKLVSDVSIRTTAVETKIWIAYGGLAVMSILVIPIFINVISGYFTSK